MHGSRSSWFNSNILLCALVVLAALPLVLPDIPPLTDLPGHMARYRIELDLHRSPYLHQWFNFQWVFFGNLGVDLLIVPMSKMFGLELGTKLIVLAIPTLTVMGMLYVAREVHGHIPATAFFALPLAYGYPFQFGFVNFALSMALAFLSIGLWLHLARLRRYRLRAVLFAMISPALFLAHCIGWAMFGVILFSIELMRRRQEGVGWLESLRRTVWVMLPLGSALVLIILWWGHDPTGRTAYFSWYGKIQMLLFMVLRDRFAAFDVYSALFLWLLVLFGMRRMGFAINRGMAVAATLLLLVYLMTPGVLKDAFYADMRMTPYILTVFLLGLAPLAHDRRWHHAIALAGLVFCAARFGTQAWSYHELEQDQRRQLSALDHIDRGARVLVLVNTPCDEPWSSPRTEHLGSMAIVRRDAYANGMWPMPGGRLVTNIYAAAGPFAYSPSQVLRPARCRAWDNPDPAQALGLTKSGAFDYLWLIDTPNRRGPALPWLRRVWSGPMGGVLYRIDNSTLTLYAHKS